MITHDELSDTRNPADTPEPAVAEAEALAEGAATPEGTATPAEGAAAPAETAAAPAEAAPARAPRGPTPVNIRNFSVRCGRCDQYQVIVAFARLDEEWNLYTYECDSEPCVSEPSVTRTFIEVPVDLDEFANRNPNWRGGKKWGGA